MNYLKNLPDKLKEFISANDEKKEDKKKEIATAGKFLQKIPNKDLTKVKITNKKQEKKFLDEYIKARKEWKKIQLAIQNEPDKEKKKILEAHEKSVIEKINEIEENFYNPNKGLWLGIAMDIEDVVDNPEADIFLLYLDWKKLTNHFSVYGTSGYGKSRLFAIILRQMVATGWSIFAVDPKGGEKKEIANWIYEYAIKHNRNHTVMRIMASYPNESDKMNPIFGMSDEEISNFCKSLTVTGVGVESSDEKYFTGQVYRIALAICSATRFLEKSAFADEDGQKVLYDRIVHEAQKYMAFKNNETETFYEDDEYIFPDAPRVANSPTQSMDDTERIDIDPFNRTLITFKELAYYGQYDNLKDLYDRVNTATLPNIDKNTKEGKRLLSELRELKAVALGTLKPLVNMDKAKYDAVGDTFSVLMSQLAYGPIGKIFCTIRVNPLRFKMKSDEGVIVLFEPAPMRFESVSEMMMKVYIKMFLSLFGEIGSSGKGVKRRVALMIDEAKPMMYPGIDELYNKTRQLGMTIGAFFQSKSDLKSKLGDVLADIVEDNTATQIFMKQVSATSQEEVAISFGTKKMAVNVHMSEVDTPGGRNTIMHEERPLLVSTDIDGLQIGEAVIRHYGKKYFVKFPIQKDAQDIMDMELSPLESEIVYDQYSRAEATAKAHFIEMDRINAEFEKTGL